MKRFTSETLVAAVLFLFASSAGSAIDVSQLACNTNNREQGSEDVCTYDESDCRENPGTCDACGVGACAGKPLCYTVRFVTGTEAGEFGLDPDNQHAVRTLCFPNLRPAAVLSRLDIDQDGVADNSPDTDGDGLPDSWEEGGVEALSADGSAVDRVVFYPAPTAIVPGTPPTPIFTRLAVTTNALDPDTDGDGLTDFVEVFGLKFIDENSDGILQSSGNVSLGREWVEDGSCSGLLPGGEVFNSPDRNAILDAELSASRPGDGIPGPGECPRDNSRFANGFGRVDATDNNAQSFLLLHDFDGFVFTDPVNSDTDGDSVNDKEDNDPLINPRAFGETGNIIVKFNVEGVDDFDQDGLGNGMDMGNDLVITDFSGGSAGARTFQEIDNPQNVVDLLELFRRDLLFIQRADGTESRRANPTVPEAAIEDLLGVDWDGNGLWRTTDVRTWRLVIADDLASRTRCFPLRAGAEATRAADPTCPPEDLFTIGDRDVEDDEEQRIYLFAQQSFSTLQDAWMTGPPFGERGIGLGWQDLLSPTGSATNFIPDRRVWAILYSWRVPGFDIDGDGFVGVPNFSSTAAEGGIRVQLESAPNGGTLLGNALDDDDRSNNLADNQVDDFIAIPEQRNSGGGDAGDLDGRINVGSLNFCGATGLISMGLIFAGLCGLRVRVRGRKD